MIDFRLNFGGFYNSIHDDIIEQQLDLADDERFNVDYKTLQATYCEEYLEAFSDFLSTEFNIQINLEFKELISPKMYNFETDRILTSISTKDTYSLFKYFCNFEKVKSFINENSKSYDGYLSFCIGYDDVKKDNSLLLSYLFDYIIDNHFTDEKVQELSELKGYEL